VGSRARRSNAQASCEAVVSWPGHERGHQLVAQLLCAHRRAVLVPRGEQQSEDVIAAVLLAAALLDQLEDELVDLLAEPFEAGHGREPGEPNGRRWQQRQGTLAEREQAREQLAQGVEPCASLQPEHRAQDDLQREPLQPRVQLHGPLARPVGELVLGQLDHQPGQALHALAVEGWQQQLALLQVLALVEQEHRVAAHERFEDPGALAGVEHLGWRHEHFPDLVGVGDHHHRRLAGDADGEACAVAGATALEEGGGATPHAQRLHQRGHPRSGG
jgi:hypothetical protein